MIARKIRKHVKELAAEFPVVTVFGPRQSGKSTLVKAMFPSHEYVSLEDMDVRMHALEDPRGFLDGHKDPVVFDEIQRVPDLLGYIRSAHGLEADLAIDDGLSKRIYEIKSSRTFHASFSDNLVKLRALSSEFDYGGVIYDGDIAGVIHGVPFRNFRSEDFHCRR